MTSPPTQSGESHAGNAGSPKSCAKCGVDCTSIARVKDERGRYFCKACYDKAIAAMASRIIESAPAARGDAAARSAAPASVPVASQTPIGLDAMDEPADLLNEAATPEQAAHDVEIYALAEPERPKNHEPMRDCPSCGREMRERDSNCPHCGFNTVLNVEADEDLPTVTAVFKSGKACCGKCGYCIEKLGSLKCPECGSPNRIPRRSAWDQEDSEKIARTQIIRPGIYLAVGLVGYGIIAIMEKSIGAFLGMLIIYAVSLPAVIGAFLACSFLWLGFGDRLRNVIWKLAGITALTFLPLFFFEGSWFIPMVLAGLTFSTLIRVELDVDQGDAWLVGLAVLIAQFAMFAAVVWFLKWIG